MSEIWYGDNDGSLANRPMPLTAVQIGIRLAMTIALTAAAFVERRRS